ncbi:MAG: DUF4435 domain-containing protein [Clostridia bacterium]|nr:DUF4435 domain-containing protein [Clostridia bacterium]
MGHKSRRNVAITRQRSYSQSIVNYVLDEIEEDKKKIGVLLCEGDENSIDKQVYSAIFPELVIVPLGCCCTIMRILNRVKRTLAASGIYAFGIIDRDALSKSEIKKLKRERGVYTTKLPFIENIICTPEVIRYVCEDLKLDYNEVIEKINEQLMKALWQKLKEALPINLGIERNERIESLEIGAHTKNKNIRKLVDRNNILYAYRSKVIVSIVASEVHISGRDEYYKKIEQMLSSEKYHANLVKAMARYVPNLELYDFDEVLKV